MVTRTHSTVDDVLRLGERGIRVELIDGELVPMSPTGSEHAQVEAYVSWVFNNHVIPRNLGTVMVGEPLFRLDPPERLARAPDVAFIRRDRLSGIDWKGPFVGAPDLAVEIVSPGDTAGEVQIKVETWLANGTLAVLLMYPDSRSVVLWRARGAERLTGDDILNLGSAMPGFRAAIRDLFPLSIEDLGGSASNLSDELAGED